MHCRLRLPRSTWPASLCCLAEAGYAVGRAAEAWLHIAAVVLALLVVHIDVVVQIVRLAEAGYAIGRAAEVWPRLTAVVRALLVVHVGVVVQLVRLAEASYAVGRAAEDWLHLAVVRIARPLIYLCVLRTDRAHQARQRWQVWSISRAAPPPPI